MHRFSGFILTEQGVNICSVQFTERYCYSMGLEETVNM